VSIYFALFALLYGQRLWVQAELLGVLVPHSPLFERLRSGIDFLVPLPAFLFFDAAGLLHRRAKIVGYVLGILLGSLALATFSFGPSPSYHLINNVVVIVVLVLLVIQSLLNSDRNRDFVVIRRGLLIFVAFALWDNLAEAFGLASKIEPFGVVAFWLLSAMSRRARLWNGISNSTPFKGNLKWLVASSCPFCRRSFPIPNISRSLLAMFP